MSGEPPKPPPVFHDTPLPPPPPPQRKSALWVILVVLGSLLAVVVMFVGASALFVLSGQEQEVTSQDRSVILDIHELADWMEGYAPDEQGESIVKTRYLDGSMDVEYEYDVPDDPEAPYLNCSVTIERRTSDAHTSYVSLWSVSQLSMSVLGEDIEVVERNDLFRWGEQSRFAILTSGGEPFGNLFIARQDKQIFYVMLAGVYFDEPESIRDLLDVPLSRLPSYSP